MKPNIVYKKGKVLKIISGKNYFLLVKRNIMKKENKGIEDDISLNDYSVKNKKIISFIDLRNFVFQACMRGKSESLVSKTEICRNYA